MILLEVEVLAKGGDVGERLGNPQPFKPGQPGAQAAPAAPAPAQQSNVLTNQSNKPAQNNASEYTC